MAENNKEEGFENAEVSYTSSPSYSLGEWFESNFGGEEYFSKFPELGEEEKEIKDENEQLLFWAFEMCGYEEEFSIKYIKHFGYNPTLETLIVSSDIQKLEKNLTDSIIEEYGFTEKQAKDYIKKYGVFTVLHEFKTEKIPKPPTFFDKMLRRR